MDGLTHRQTDKQMDGWTDSQTELTGRFADNWIGKTDVQTDGRMVRQMYEYINGWTSMHTEGQTYKQNE